MPTIKQRKAAVLIDIDIISVFNRAITWVELEGLLSQVLHQGRVLNFPNAPPPAPGTT